MKEEQLIELIHKKSTNTLTTDERQMLNTLLENKENQLFAQQIEATWAKSLDYQKDFTPNVEFGLSKLKTRIKEEKNDFSQSRSPPKQEILVAHRRSCSYLNCRWFIYF